MNLSDATLVQKHVDRVATDAEYQEMLRRGLAYHALYAEDLGFGISGKLVSRWWLTDAGHVLIRRPAEPRR